MTTTPNDQTEFPQEICAKALPLVHFAGLDCVNNAVHKGIWDAFANNRRSDRVPLLFRTNNSCEFPIAKPKRNSYEWYVPKGILKKNWIYKRLALVPAVIVTFYDLEWDDIQWNEKLIECVSRVQSIRAAMEGHLIRICVVVIQSGIAPNSSENSIGAERAQALCQACDVQSKSLFVLPQGENMLSYVVRLETAFFDLAQAYYHQETKLVKQHRDHLNKSTHQYLFVRHQFKLGFLNEMRQDLSTAHKHYMYAYNNLLDVRMFETNTNEVKTVAGFINYKLCKLLFGLNLPRDAIGQFRAHIDRYKGKSGQSELIFEHYAWLARQYSAFGELFDEAIKAGLPAIQSQHPGFYYQTAAQHTVKRRQSVIQLCGNMNLEYPNPDPLEGTIEFYGQRPWHPGRLSADPYDPLKEDAAKTALQYKERQFNHSSMIINFLGSAIAQFKTFHSPRMRRQLVVEMANEYYLSADYGKALTLLSHMLYDYRREKWWYLASHVLNKALCCAYLSAKVQDYINLSIEALSNSITVPNNDKLRIFNNIKMVMNMCIPHSEEEHPKSSLDTALENWKISIEKEPFYLKVDMSTLTKFLHVKVGFSQLKYKPQDKIIINLYAKLCCPIELEVKKIIVVVSTQSQSIEIGPNEEQNSEIVLKNGEVKRFECHHDLNEDNVTSDLLIKSVVFSIGGSKRSIDLNFSLTNNIAEKSIHPELLHFITGAESEYEFDSILSMPVARISPRESKFILDASHPSPALQGEWYKIQLSIQNHEELMASNVSILLNLGTSPENPNPEASTKLALNSDDMLKEKSSLQETFVHLEAGETKHVNVLLKSMKVSTISLVVNINYFIESNKGRKYQCLMEQICKIDVVKPFEIVTNFCTTSFENIEKCFLYDSFLVMPQLKILSPWDLVIEVAELELNEPFKFLDKDTSKKQPSSCLNTEVLREGVVTTDVFAVVADKFSSNKTMIGLYNVQWKRKQSSCDFNIACNSVLSSIPLPSLAIENGPVKVESELVGTAEFHKPMTLECKFKSTRKVPVRVNFTAEGTDTFMFAGYKKRTVTIRPDDYESLQFVINPFACGDVAPPKLKATVEAVVDSGMEDMESRLIQEVIDINNPSNIYIMPQNTTL